MQITSSKEQGRVPVIILHLTGDLNTVGSEELDEAAQRIIATGAKDLLIDMSGVPFMSSAGLRSLHKLYNQLDSGDKGGDHQAVMQGISAGTYKAEHIKLLNPNKRVVETLKMSGMDMFLEIFIDQKKAVAAF
jgi:anti-anti-sigma factor